jgi:hypothetical protein
MCSVPNVRQLNLQPSPLNVLIVRVGLFRIKIAIATSCCVVDKIEIAVASKNLFPSNFYRGISFEFEF